MINFLLYLLIVFSGAYFRYIGIGLVHVALGVAAIGYVLLVLKNKTILVPRKLWFAFILSCYLIIQYLFIGGEIKTLFLIFFSIFYYYLVLVYGNACTSEKILFCTRHYLNFSIIILIIEALVRFAFPYGDGLLYGSFYPYKSNSFMFFDSNFTGLFSIVLFFLCEYLCMRNYGKFRIQRLLLLVLTFATLSRAAIISLITFKILFSIIFKRINHNKIKISWYRVFVVLLLISLTLSYLLNNIQDNSFNSKLYIVGIVQNYLYNAEGMTTLFGAGQMRSGEVLGIYAHNILFVLTVEVGILGLIMFGIFWSTFIAPHYLTAIIFLPFLFAAMSAFGHAITYLYTAIAIIQLLEFKSQNIKDC